MKKLFFLTALMATLNALPVFASDADNQPADCGDDRLIANNIQLNRSSFSDGTVFISIHPMKATDLIYRDYLVTGEGMLMVFNSFGWGENSESTAAREFYFFPRLNTCITYQVNIDGDVQVGMPSGKVATFSQSSAQLANLEGAMVTVAEDVLPSNKGGVEIVQYNGLMMDAGYRTGASPTENPNGTSIFRDAKGATCKIINRELFDYANDDVKFRMSDLELKKFLAKKCSKLEVSY